MAIVIAPFYTQRSYTWTNWKTAFTSKGSQHQYDDDGTVYTIWFYDAPEVHICTIYKGTVPDGIISGGYSQAQNDSDKSDFTTNYQSTANAALDAGTLANGAETAVSSSAVQVVAANTKRRALILQNTGSNNVRIGVSGVTATTGVRLAAGATLVLERPNVPTQAIYAIRESSDSTVLAQEIT